jgi:hypothetical protein
MKRLYLDELKEGLPGISKTVGAFLVEAAVVCLTAQNHKPGVLIRLSGNYEVTFELFWRDEMTEQIRKTWKDEKEAAEYGASAIAILVLLALTKFVISERGVQMGVADYLLTTRENNANLSNLKSPSAHLEVSGIWKEHPKNTINMRLNAKKKQVKQAIEAGETVLIVVTEFGIPKAKIKWYNYEHHEDHARHGDGIL